VTESNGGIIWRVGDNERRLGEVEKDQNGLGGRVGRIDTAIQLVEQKVGTVEKSVEKIEKSVDRMAKKVENLQVRLAFIVGIVTVGVNLFFRFWK